MADFDEDRDALNPGCPALSHEGYCPRHAKGAARERHRRMDAGRESAPKRGYGWTWHKLRSWYLRSLPLCEGPYGRRAKADRIETAQMVHHKVPLDEGGENRESNLMSLCLKCHGRLTQAGYPHHRGPRGRGRKARRSKL